jgi:hypothetical protein
MKSCVMKILSTKLYKKCTEKITIRRCDDKFFPQHIIIINKNCKFIKIERCRNTYFHKKKSRDWSDCSLVSNSLNVRRLAGPLDDSSFVLNPATKEI